MCQTLMGIVNFEIVMVQTGQLLSRGHQYKSYIDHINDQHYDDIIMSAIASQITSLTIVYSIVYSDADQRKHQSSASLAFVWGIHRGPVNSPHKGPVTRKMFPFDDVIMHIDWLLIPVRGMFRFKSCIRRVVVPLMNGMFNWDCCWPWDTRSQDISSRGTDLFPVAVSEGHIFALFVYASACVFRT